MFGIEQARRIIADTDWNKNILWKGEGRFTFAMVEPTNFGIAAPDPKNGSANTKEAEYYKEYQADPESFVEKTVADWHKAVKAMNEEANIIIVPTIPNTDTEKFYDQVFMADASLSMQNDKGALVTMFSKFSNTERIPEVNMHKAFLEVIDDELLKRGYLEEKPKRIFADMPHYFEGTGDCRYDYYRGVFFAGYIDKPCRANAHKGRSDIRSHDVVANWTGAPINSIKTESPCFHIDTSTLFACETPYVFMDKNGIDKRSVEKFNNAAFRKYGLKPAEYVIELSPEEADNFAANSLYIGNHKMVVPIEAGKDFSEKVRNAGLTPIEIPIAYLVKAGGAFNCIKNPLYRKHIPGGFAAHPELIPGISA